MQIDFHYAVTYAIARLANFSPEDAGVIAYSAQYVDDAVNSGTVRFRNRAMYSRISSAHSMLDYRNFKELANHFTWVPFHFLPGNGGKKAGDNPDGGFINKLVCYPNSYVAEDMVASCIEGHDRPYGLHRLGITMHVLADTFAHQGFAGVNHEINRAKILDEDEKDPDSLIGKVKGFFGDLFDKAANTIVSDVLPLGHGAALSCPDMPFLKWSYENGHKEKIVRDNTDIFMEAVLKLHEKMVCYRNKDPEYILMDNEKISEKDLSVIRSNFENFTDEEGEDRMEKWISSIKNGDLSFSEPGQEEPAYIPKGIGSWKYAALDTKREFETKKELYRFTPDFMTSDWKNFHDALQIHRIDIIRNILPKYDICNA